MPSRLLILSLACWLAGRATARRIFGRRTAIESRRRTVPARILYTLLYSASQRGQVDRVTALLATFQFRNFAVQDALCIAVWNDYAGVVRVLQAAAAAALTRETSSIIQRNARTSALPTAGFHARSASAVGSVDVLAELSSFPGVLMNASLGCGDTPLHIACRLGQTQVVRRLIAAKVPLGPKNAACLTPLDLAAVFGGARVLREVLRALLVPDQLPRVQLIQALALCSGRSGCKKTSAMLRWAIQRK